MSSLLALIGSGVKSTQSGSIAITSGAGSATITAVNTAKSVIVHCGSLHGTSGTAGNGGMNFASSTSISASWVGTGGVIYYTVVEYF